MVSDFDAIYQEYGKTVYCFLLSLSRDETLSEELTQETMFRAIISALSVAIAKSPFGSARLQRICILNG